jgi:hypothetical protein
VAVETNIRQSDHALPLYYSQATDVIASDEVLWDAALLEAGHNVGGCPSFQLACYPGDAARYGKPVLLLSDLDCLNLS